MAYTAIHSPFWFSVDKRLGYWQIVSYCSRWQESFDSAAHFLKIYGKQNIERCSDATCTLFRPA